MIKRIGLLLLALWAAGLAIRLLFQALDGLVGGPSGVWMPVAFSIGFVISAVPAVVAAWLIARWEGLQGLQLVATTAVAYLLGVVVGVLVGGPVVNAFLRAGSVISGYASTALVGLLGAVIGITVYWLVALVSKRWFARGTNGAI